MPLARGLVRIVSSLSLSSHHVRVIAPMLDQHPHNILQLNGIYVERWGKVNGQSRPAPLTSFFEKALTYGVQDLLKWRATDSSDTDKPAHGNTGFSDNNNLLVTPLMAPTIAAPSRRLLEVVTDSPGFYLGSERAALGARAADIAAFVGAWEFQLGEMFSAAHTSTSVAGMCLIANCSGGMASPVGLGDAYFRSGPPSSLYYPTAWDFTRYAPDAVVLHLGSSDGASFALHAASYGEPIFDLHARFERDYVAFVAALRKSALGTGAVTSDPMWSPALVPIFIMRPLTGALEHASQNVVQRLRAAGDPRVFWIDTTGWVAPPPATIDYSAQNGTDQLTGEAVQVWTLNAQGNARVALFLHEHVCRFLAEDPSRCNFLPPDEYAGAGYAEKEQRVQRMFERERAEKLRERFGWL